MDNSRTTPDSHTQWLTQLRQRFAEVAGRRVPADAVEDLVHDALGIVLAKGPAEAEKEGRKNPPLGWSFNVLRNVIGNYYQKRRSFDELEDHEILDEKPDTLAVMTSEERALSIRSAVGQLRLTRPDCADWLWSLAQGIKAGDLADQARMQQAAFYRKIYRCRKMLAEILKQRGVGP